MEPQCIALVTIIYGRPSDILHMFLLIGIEKAVKRFDAYLEEKVITH